MNDSAFAISIVKAIQNANLAAADFTCKTTLSGYNE